MSQEHKLILVGLDGSDESIRALQWADRQAQLTESKLRVLAVLDRPSGLTAGLVYDPVRERRLEKERIKGIVATTLGAQRSGQAEVILGDGYPAKELIDASAKADMIVIGSRGLGGFAGMLLGSVSHHLVAHAKCPVVIVR